MNAWEANLNDFQVGLGVDLGEADFC